MVYYISKRKSLNASINDYQKAQSKGLTPKFESSKVNGRYRYTTKVNARKGTKLPSGFKMV